MMMNVEEIPNWVPSTVKKLAVWFYGFEDDLVWRLVADPQMKSAWQYLLRRAQPVDSAIAEDYSKLFLELGVSETSVSVQERTCAIFFWLVVMELSVQGTAATRQDIENSVAPWRSAAEQCRLAIGSLGSGGANRELAKALSISAEYFEFKARIAGENANSPYTLKRRSGEPEDNTGRGRVRALALIIMPFNDPRWMGGIGMIGTKADYHAVMHCDLFVMLGTDYPYSEFLPRECIVIQVDERARVIGRRAPTQLGVIGSVRPTVKALLDRVRPKSDSGFFDRVTAQRKAWDEMQDKQADPARSKDVIHPQAVARMVSDLAKRDAVFTIDTGLNTLWSGNWIRQSGEQRIIGSFNNGAVGTALGQANGIQALDCSRQVIALCGDGGFNMLMCEFLTAVHHKLPVKAVVYNNSSLGLIRFEAKSMGLPAWKAMDFPNPDYVALARACSAVGFKAEKPGELRDAIDQALKADGPAIVSCVVPADEMPNFPHVDLEKAENFAKAKVKEALLAFTGG